jgi:lipoprotein-releasing system permease protein
VNSSVAIALRYIRPRRLSAIGLIGGISVVGIAVGTAALIIVLSLFNGFRGVAIDSMTSAGPHVRVVGNAASIVSGINGVALASHVYQSTLVVQLPGRTTAARTLGVSNTPAVVDDLARSTVIGVADIAQRQGLSGAVVSLELAEALNVYLGDTLVVLAPEAIESSLLTMSIPTGARVEVHGILTPATSGASASVQMYMLDTVLTSIARASAVAYTDIRLVDADRADNVAQTLRERGYQAEPWREMHRTMFDMMRLERIGSFIVLSLIVVVAAFNILVSLTLGVMEKRRDIAILKAIGATDRQIHQIFQLQGLAFGVGSVLVGSVLGVGLCIGQRTFQWIRFDITQGYAIPALPVDVYALDVIIVACMGILCAGLAAQYPARRAARIVVADAVRSR